LEPLFLIERGLGPTGPPHAVKCAPQTPAAATTIALLSDAFRSADSPRTSQSAP
jgi:hypothetical protein